MPYSIGKIEYVGVKCLKPPANTPLQPTASRARSVLFWQPVAARSRQLNGNPFGHFAM
jgi:hypothetical protein